MKTPYHFQLPIDQTKLFDLCVGDVIYLSGMVFTARDEAHRLLTSQEHKKIPFEVNGMALYHCGPLVKKINDDFQVVSAGPTTSSRMEGLLAPILHFFPTVSIIIGKGGMGEKSVQLLKNRGVYLVYTGGAGALAADQIKKVVDVAWYDELGMTDAVWVFEVEEFGPVIVGIDAHGHSLFKTRNSNY